MKTYSEHQPESFRPLTVSFTIETQKELDTLRNFFRYDLSIPREYGKMSKCDVNEINFMENFMIEISRELIKNV